MAEIKRRTLLFSSGKQVKLFGNSIGIGKSLEIGEGYAPNILAQPSGSHEKDMITPVNNPHGLTTEEIMELADYMMHLWLQLKENLRHHGLNSPKLFARD